tara:strand:+ start:170 stop:364 length:195 start_codon:yes stop_codon:yes gene_type:complete
MFKALVMVCSLADPTQCTIFEDTIKLRETEELCKVRIEEMVEVIQMTMDYPVEYKYKCEPKKSV